MPLTSGLAAVFAFLLIFWNKVMVTLGKLGRLFRASDRGPNELAPTPQEGSTDSSPKR